MVRKANQYAGIYKSQHPISKGNPMQNGAISRVKRHEKSCKS